MSEQLNLVFENIGIAVKIEKLLEYKLIDWVAVDASGKVIDYGSHHEIPNSFNKLIKSVFVKKDEKISRYTVKSGKIIGNFQKGENE